MATKELLGLTPSDRAVLWSEVTAAIERYAGDVESLPVAPTADRRAVEDYIASVDGSSPISPKAAIAFAVEGLRRFQVQTPHPMYYGLFNPTPTAMGIAADALTAAFNPQLAAWAHNPFAVEVEQRLLKSFGAKFGYEPDECDGTFCTGGAEANHTALLVALTHRFPAVRAKGLRALPPAPVLYASGESHHSVTRAARASGLGDEAVHVIPVGDDLKMDVAKLEEAIASDRRSGFAPFMVVATAGSTSAGAIDPLQEAANVAEREGLWYHVDAAWGGAAVLVPELRHVLDGIERADSITFDAHKWLSAPMGAGMFLTRHPTVLSDTFDIRPAYVPKDAAPGVVNPYAHSMQWSRRFTGLKVFLALAVAGWEGYAAVIREQARLGELLRRELKASGWRLLNPTPLPIACFDDPACHDEDIVSHLGPIVEKVVGSGAAWVSLTTLATGRPAIRACVTSYQTEERHILKLVRAVTEARSA